MLCDVCVRCLGVCCQCVLQRCGHFLPQDSLRGEQHCRKVLWCCARAKSTGVVTEPIASHRDTAWLIPRRWQDHLRSTSCLQHKKVDILMLDTTYAGPRWTFPPQQQAIEMMVQVSYYRWHVCVACRSCRMILCRCMSVGSDTCATGAAALKTTCRPEQTSRSRVAENLCIP